MWIGKSFFLILVLSLIYSSCSSARFENGYVSEYQYLNAIRNLRNSGSRQQKIDILPESFLVVHTQAPHINYRSFQTFIESLHKGLLFSRDPRVGHAWITISSLNREGKRIYYEIGHSGELGISAPRYLDEILRRSEDCLDENPIRYLYTTLPDGYREDCCDSYRATLSALFPITSDQFLAWVNFTFGNDPYDFSRWSLRNHNCVTYIQASLAVCGILSNLPEKAISISRTFSFSGRKYTLWNDEQYKTFSCITVDSLEKWLLSSIQSGRASYISPRQIAIWKNFWEKRDNNSLQ